MRIFSAQALLVLALWTAGSALGQDDLVTDSVDVGDALTDSPLDATTTSLEVPDPEPSGPAEDDPTQTDSEPEQPTDGETSPTEVTDTPTDIPTDTQATETTPSGTAVEDATSTEDMTETETAQETPSASTDLGDENDIVLVEDSSRLVNSTDDYESVKSTEETWAAEEEAVKSKTEISEDDAQQIAIFEGHYFNDFVENAPASGDREQLQIPTNASECEPDFNNDKRSLRKRIWPFGNRKPPCINVYYMDVTVHYNYILPTTDGAVPKNLWQRINDNHALMQKAFESFGIRFAFASGRYWYPPRSGDNSLWDRITRGETRMENWQRQSHQGDKMTMNVWIVNDVFQPPAQPGGNLSPLLGYGTWPWDTDRNGKIDGVVITQSAVDTLVHTDNGEGSTLIHEAGHWLGLGHTFGVTTRDPATDCKSGDGLLGTTHTRGLTSVCFQCQQRPCFGPQDLITVDNWMSYSVCPGSTDGSRGFSTDQKAAVYARTVYYRRGLRRAECNPRDPGTGNSKVKRGTMQDLVDGKCPDVQAAAEEIAESSEELLSDESDGNGGNGGGGDDDEDVAAGLRIVPAMLWAIVGFVSFFTLM